MSVRTLARQLSHFLGGNIIGLLLSLVSFPILTRLLDQSHYGILVLVNTTMSLAVAVAKGGTSEAIVRFYGDYAGSPAQLRVFTSTVLVTRGIQAVVAVAVYLIALYLVFLFAGLEPVALTAFLIMAPYVASGRSESYPSTTSRHRPFGQIQRCLDRRQGRDGSAEHPGTAAHFEQPQLVFRRDARGGDAGYGGTAVVAVLEL